MRFFFLRNGRSVVCHGKDGVVRGLRQKQQDFSPLWGIRQCIVHKNGQNLCDALRIQRAVTVSRIPKGKLQGNPLGSSQVFIFFIDTKQQIIRGGIVDL